MFLNKILPVVAAVCIAMPYSFAQGEAKSKDKSRGKAAEKMKEVKNKEMDERQKHEYIIWNGVKNKDGAGPLPSKNQPAKVRAAFKRDYPNAVNVSWSKYRGDWTATFRNGPFWSTAIYHANGERKDTRTVVPSDKIPKKIEDIFKKKPEVKPEDVIKIEIPKTIKEIFRIKLSDAAGVRFVFYDAEGAEVQYDY
jgi:hypothetical protein